MSPTHPTRTGHRDTGGAPVALPSYRCSDPGCQRVWQHLGGPLPFTPVPDPSDPGSRGWHPCPSCADEGPSIAELTHLVRARACPELVPAPGD